MEPCLTNSSGDDATRSVFLWEVAHDHHHTGGLNYFWDFNDVTVQNQAQGIDL